MVPLFPPRPVLEVGSGHRPFPQSDCLVDRYLDNRQRGGNLVRGGRPLVIADVENLPFADGAFGYSICSHVLEHVTDPARATAELARVSRAGYVETPSALYEMVQPGRGYHRWIIGRDGLGLRFRPKPSEWGRSSRLVADLGQSNLAFRLFASANRDLMVTRFEWEGVLPVRVDGEAAFDPDEYVPLAAQGPAGFVAGLASRVAEVAARGPLSGLIRAAAAGFAGPLDLASVLRCTLCRGPVRVERDRVTCASCGGHFPRAEEVWDMLDSSFVKQR